MTIRKNVTLAFFEKNVFLLKEVHFNVFWIFSATLNPNYGQKKKKTKRPRVRFSYGHEEHPAKFHFPTLIESGRKSD